MFFAKRFFDIQTMGGGIAINPFAGAKEGDIKLVTEDTPIQEEKVEVEDKVPEKVEEKVEKPDEKVEEKTVEDKEEKQSEEVEETEETPDDEPEEVKPPVFNLDEELKKIDKYEAMKKLGFDDWEIDLLKYKEQTGDLTPYLEAKTVDYTKFTDEQMMRHDLRKQYKGLSDEALDLLYEQKVNEQYKLDAEIHGEAAAKLGRELLKFEADKIRQREIEAQNKFKAPEKPVDDTAQRFQQEQEAKIKEYQNYVNESKNTKALLKDKRLVFGEGETAFNYTVEKPKDLVATALNPNLLFNDMVDKDGNADLVKVYKAKAYIANMSKIEQMLIAHGETIGKKKAFDELQNPSHKEAEPSVQDTNLTPAQALAKYGSMRASDD